MSERKQSWINRLLGRESPEARRLNQLRAELRGAGGALQQRRLRARVLELVDLADRVLDNARSSGGGDAALAQILGTLEQVAAPLSELAALEGVGLDAPQQQRIAAQFERSLDGLIDGFKAQLARSVTDRLSLLNASLEGLGELGRLEAESSPVQRYYSVAILRGQRLDISTLGDTDPFGLGLSWTVTGYDGDAPFRIVPCCIPVGEVPVQAGRFAAQAQAGGPEEDLFLFRFAVSAVPEAVERLVFALVIEKPRERRQTFAMVRDLAYRVLDPAGCELAHFRGDEAYSSQTALAAVVLYRRDGKWRIMVANEGFTDGVTGLRRAYPKGYFAPELLALG
ncbi:MAG: TerD family protein [Candidatus Schekmanbacteria bacterium]|nr:TerD family protein [Candidatus Schekmanbacteria bacterium]